MKKNIPITLDEILFLNRNREYGSYKLRKKYHVRLFISFLISVTSLLIVAISYFWHLNAENYVVKYPTEIPYSELKSIQGSLLSQEDLNSFLQNEQQTKNKLSDPLHNFTIAEKKVPLKDTVTQINSGSDTLRNQKASTNSNTNDSLYFAGNALGDSYGINNGDYLDKFPEFPGGGIEGVRKYIEFYTKYPSQAQKEKIHGTVLVSFDVNLKGEIDNVKIVRSDNNLFNDEAYTVVKNMPRWKPGIRHGKPVTVKFIIPITFMPMAEN